MSECPQASHDPLCPRADDDDPRARPCWCVQIAAVRADERLASLYAKDFYEQGYTAALSAARDAVAALLDEFPNPDFQIANAAVHTALATIDGIPASIPGGGA